MGTLCRHLYLSKFLQVGAVLLPGNVPGIGLNKDIQGGSEKSGIFSSYFKMTQHSWKSPDFIKVKRNLQGYILRIILFIKTAVSSNSSLDPGPRAFAGLCHGVPVEEPHHILYLLDQILGFVARLCNDTWFKFALLNIAKRVTIRRAGRPDLLLLHPRKVSLSQSSCVLLLS